uniref:glucuronosyltransferase n=1 Tax=Romanomermis culicivorax TaxID=13658 RepID=A0A915JR59_ROMCU
EALLVHPKTKLFISHGGLKSITETICAGVPALVIPFFAEQIRNAHLLVKHGSGVVLNKFNLTSNSIFAESSRILSDSNFSRNIQKLKNYFNDQPLPTIDNGAFWTEFVIRHQNDRNFRKFFRLHETNMSWIELFMIDIFVFFFIIPFFSTFFIVRLVRKTLRF